MIDGDPGIDAAPVSSVLDSRSGIVLISSTSKSTTPATSTTSSAASPTTSTSTATNGENAIALIGGLHATYQLTCCVQLIQ